MARLQLATAAGMDEDLDLTATRQLDQGAAAVVRVQVQDRPQLVTGERGRDPAPKGVQLLGADVPTQPRLCRSGGTRAAAPHLGTARLLPGRVGLRTS